jgi:molybdopterin-biosynthesis enzyme MoeA-like protein
MVEWVLDTQYRHLHHRAPEAEASIVVYGSAESILTPLMVEVERRYAKLKVFSLPSMGEQGVRRHIELGVRGDPAEVALAIETLKQGVVAVGATFEPA